MLPAQGSDACYGRWSQLASREPANLVGCDRSHGSPMSLQRSSPISKSLWTGTTCLLVPTMTLEKIIVPAMAIGRPNIPKTRKRCQRGIINRRGFRDYRGFRAWLVIVGTATKLRPLSTKTDGFEHGQHDRGNHGWKPVFTDSQRGGFPNSDVARS
jgi:hypothetical protein